MNVDEEPDLARRFESEHPTVVFEERPEFDRRWAMPRWAFSGVLDTNPELALGSVHSPNPELKQAGPRAGPACFCLGGAQSPRGGNLPSVRPLLRPAGALPRRPARCPQPIRWCGNSGFRLVPSYHNGAQGLGQGKRPGPEVGSRNRRFLFRFAKKGNSARRPGRELWLCDFTVGAFPDGLF